MKKCTRLLVVLAIFSPRLGPGCQGVHAANPKPSASTAPAAEKPALLPLPDPLVMADGTPVTTAEQWRQQRRPELLRLLEENIYGKTLLGRPEVMRFVVREEKIDARNGEATRLRVGILFEGREDGRQMELLLYLPNAAEEPVGLFLGLNFDGNFSTTDEADLPIPQHYVTGLYLSVPEHKPAEFVRGHNSGMWPYDMILDRGYGIATGCYNEVEPDEPGHWAEGPRGMVAEPQAGDWGTIGVWAWALSRAMDYLETEPRVDARRVAVFGFSRLGKTAMWAGAQDERFAAVISQESGKGGVSLSKHLVGEPVSHLAGRNLAHWFARNYRQYSDHEELLPVDGRDLAALVAPRGLLILSGIRDDYSDPEGEFLSGVAATPVYELLGSQGLAAKDWPKEPTFINSRLGYNLREGRHDVTTGDWQVTLEWADQHLTKGLK
jgi:hypothetical protein